MRTRLLDVVGFIGQFFYEYGHEDHYEEELSEALLERGISEHEVKEAYRWMEEKALGPGSRKKHQRVVSSTRVLTRLEKNAIGPEAHGVLIDLLSRGIIDQLTADEVIARAVSSNPPSSISARQMKRLVALTVFSRLQGEWREWVQSSSSFVQ